MDAAIDSETWFFVLAQDIKNGRHPLDAQYLCPGCHVPVRPCASIPGRIFKVPPYFAVRGTGDRHADDCDSHHERALAERARTSPIWGPIRGFPLPYPSRLVLRDADNRTEVPRGRGAAVAGEPRQSEGRGQRRRALTTGTIRGPAVCYLRYPHDLARITLELPGADVRPYCDVFVQLRSIRPLRPIHIFFAPLRWKDRLETDADGFIVPLSAGDWENTQLVRGWRVRVRTDAWSETRQRSVLADIERAQQWAFQFRKEKRPAWLFFIGQQRADDPTVVEVDDPCLICAVTDEDIEVRPENG